MQLPLLLLLLAISALALISVLVLYLLWCRIGALEAAVRRLGLNRRPDQRGDGRGREKQVDGLDREYQPIAAAAAAVGQPVRYQGWNEHLRGRAIELLRSGTEPKDAARSLGVPLNELKLLAKVTDMGTNHVSSPQRALVTEGTSTQKKSTVRRGGNCCNDFK